MAGEPEETVAAPGDAIPSGPYRRTVTGHPTGLRAVATEVTGVALDRGVPAGEAHRLELAVHELLVNAAEHGNAGDRSLPIRVDVTGSAPGPVRIRIGDTGRGGPWSPTPEGAVAPLSSPRGRGLALVRAAVGSLEVRSGAGGTEVAITLR